MIRTTISKIRKVCTIAFVPRVLRGNLRYTPSICAAFGKFEKFTSAVKCVQKKSTKATGNDDLPQSPEKNLKDGISVVSLSKPVDLTINNDIDIHHTEHNVMGPDIPSNISSRASPPLYKSASATQYDKCSKVIHEIFGEPTPQEDLLVLSQVNMSNDTNHGKITTDKKTQFGIFGKYDSKPFKTTAHVNIKRITDDNHSGQSEDNFQSVLCYDAVLMNGKGTKQVKEAKSKPAEVKQEDAQQLNTSLYDVDPDEYVSKWKIDTKASKLGCNEKCDKQEIDAYWSDIYETAIENKTAYYEPNQAIDLETMNVYRSLKRGDTDLKDTSSGTRRINHTPEELNRIIHGSPFDDDLCDATVKSTTDKQNEETLAQKVERIDETPLVVAEQPKVEGFNTTPKILGNLDKPTPIANNNIDLVALRCLKLSQADVDKILPKEMAENLGIPVTGQKASRETKTDNSLQSDTLYTSGTCEVEKPRDDFSVGKFNLLNIIPNNLTGLGGMKLNPSTLQAEKQYWHGLNRTKTSKESNEVVQSKLCAEKSENTTPSADYVEPFDLKANANATEIRNDHIRTDTSALNQSDELEIRQASKPTADKHNPNLSKDIWANDHLDPKHILTCNETCPISPRPLVNVNEVHSIEGAEAVFERSVLAKCLVIEKEKKDVKAQPVTEKAGESFSPGEINLCECNNAKANKAYSFDDYIKTIKAGNSKMTDEGPMELNKRPTTEVFRATPPRLPGNEFTPQTPLVVPMNYYKQIGTMTSTIKPLESISKEATEQSTENPIQNPINTSKFHIDPKPYTAYEHLRNYPSYKTKENSGAHLVESILATSEKLQATSQKLQATSEKLEVASEQLHATKEQLQAASEELEVASEQLQATSEKLEVSCEKIDHRDAMHTNATEIPVKGTEVSSSVCHPLADVLVNSSIDDRVDPVIKPPVKPSAESQVPIVATTLEAEETALDQTTTKADSPKANQLANEGAALNSKLPVADQTPLSLRPLTEIKDNIKLSELMRLVKERNRLCSEQFLLTTTGQVKKNPPPMQQPRHKTPVFKPPGYPKLRPKPKTCSPRKKPKRTNCSQCDLETLGLDYNLGPQFNRNETLNNDNSYQQALQGVTLTNALPSANLSEEIILQLHNMGCILESAYTRGKIGLEAAVLAKTHFQFRSKNYTPWTPIPSWPFPKKHKRPKLQCPSEGCPAPPPRSVHDPPCGLKPCTSFPTYPKRTFSLLDYCTIRLGDPKVVDIGEF